MIYLCLSIHLDVFCTGIPWCCPTIHIYTPRCPRWSSPWQWCTVTMVMTPPPWIVQIRRNGNFFVNIILLIRTCACTLMWYFISTAMGPNLCSYMQASSSILIKQSVYRPIRCKQLPPPRHFSSLWSQPTFVRTIAGQFINKTVRQNCAVGVTSDGPHMPTHTSRHS